MSLADDITATLKYKHTSQTAGDAVLELLRDWDVKELLDELGLVTDLDEHTGVLHVWLMPEDA